MGMGASGDVRRMCIRSMRQVPASFRNCGWAHMHEVQNTSAQPLFPGTRGDDGPRVRAVLLVPELGGVIITHAPAMDAAAAI